MIKNFKYFLVSLMLIQGIGFGAEEDRENFSMHSVSVRWKLDLYYFVDCPYCQKVIRYLNQSGIAVTLKDINRDEATRAELKGLAGKTQVPCLSINGVPMFESNDIINWFEENIYRPL